jgi:hypothetical protein
MTQEIKPAYVTFEQAKFIRYPFLTDTGYSFSGKTIQRKYIITDGWINRPEQWQVVEWLRINHGIWIFLERGLEPVNFYPVIDINHKVTSFKYHPPMWHNSPQEAYSSAFDYIKDNNLI